MHSLGGGADAPCFLIRHLGSIHQTNWLVVQGGRHREKDALQLVGQGARGDV